MCECLSIGNGRGAAMGKAVLVGIGRANGLASGEVSHRITHRTVSTSSPTGTINEWLPSSARPSTPGLG
jgi:hypothetical protein